ncbi:hypothetical protein LUX57_15280 [Actinomadura madurae]|uniref:hypothetical protein n=1 Tax=Actinomadura madurae TaxID=1993 RepID=UPI0020D22C12|nr:hypothetical protein [Actinomadura madurae]MCP9966300.1 hypothetical protein [Actinomadura madurae]
MGNARAADDVRRSNPCPPTHARTRQGPRPPPPPEEAAEGAARRRFAALGTLLLTLTALPAAVLVVPDASVNIVPAAAHALGLGRSDVPALLRATGLSLPALVAAVPLGGVAARRLPAWAVLVAGLVVLLAGLWAVRFAHTVALAGTIRAVQGAGAGIVLPASLVLVWERRSRTLAAVWAGVLAGALVLAMPLALGAVPAGRRHGPRLARRARPHTAARGGRRRSRHRLPAPARARPVEAAPVEARRARPAPPRVRPGDRFGLSRRRRRARLVARRAASRRRARAARPGRPRPRRAGGRPGRPTRPAARSS